MFIKVVQEFYIKYLTAQNNKHFTSQACFWGEGHVLANYLYVAIKKVSDEKEDKKSRTEKEY